MVAVNVPDVRMHVRRCPAYDSRELCIGPSCMEIQGHPWLLALGHKTV